MRENLDSANIALRAAMEDSAERASVLRDRSERLAAISEEAASTPSSSTRKHPLQVEQRRLQRLVSQAEDAHQESLRSQRDAHVAQGHAQRNYDSTREGLHELRDALDGAPDDQSLRERYTQARSTYDQEAAQRTVKFGPQAPLSRVGLADEGRLGKRLAQTNTTAWMKSATEPDDGSGLYQHRVNLVRTADGTRRSATVPYLSSDPIGPERAADGIALQGEPTMAKVARWMEARMGSVREGETYTAWAGRIAKDGKRKPARIEHQVAKRLTSALTGFLR